MKVKGYLTGTMLFMLQIASTHAQVFLSEGFENGTKPTGWTEEYVSGTESWRYRNGGHNPNDPSWTIPPDQEDIERNPPSAHGGTYNAIFFKESTSQERTKLITKPLNLEGTIQPELSFWLCQVPWTFSGNTNWDYLRVYYKNSFDSSWTLLAEYLDYISEWTQYKVNLPNPSSTYYIAFEGQTNWGFGTCIDDVVVEEKGVVSRYVSEFTVIHPDYTFIASGSRNEPILRLGFKVFGNTGNATLNTMVVKSKNTNDNNIESNGVKLYFTTTTILDTLTPIATPQNFVNGTATFNNINYNLPNGQSYVWVTYNVTQNAEHGNIADAMLDAFSIQVSDSLYPKQTEDPTGNRVIYETIYRETFDGTSNWSLSGEFQIDTPQGLGGQYIGNPDPTQAFSGTKVLGTDLTGLGTFLGDYENDVASTAKYEAKSPAIDALFYKDIKVTYRRWLNIEVWDRADMDVSKDNGTSWSNVWYNNNYFADNLWQKISHNVTSTIARSNQLRARFTLGPTDSYSTYSGWNVDDFTLTGDHITKDVGVVEWVYPLSGCGHSASDSVIVKVSNLGAQPSPASIPVQYSFDNGTTWVTNYLNQVIAPGDTVQFTFSTKVNLTTPGIKQVRARTRLTGDEDASNDGLASQVYIVPTYTLPFAETFESNDGYWRRTSNPIWEWGIITKPTMGGGTKAWATSLSQNYDFLLTGATDTIFYDDFETTTGWTFTGEFERNQIIMQWDTIPTYTYSGSYCMGTDLSRLGTYKGMYEPNVTWYAQSPAIDVSGYNSLTLYYWRWHNIAEDDTAFVQVSSNATSWSTIYSTYGDSIYHEYWDTDTIPIPDSMANLNTLYLRFVLKANGDTIVREGINFDDIWITGAQFNSDSAMLVSPCFDFAGASMPIIDMGIFNRTEPQVDGTTLYYSTNNGQTWEHVSNAESHDQYFNWYTDSLVTALGVYGWNGLGSDWERTRHVLPSAIAGQDSVVFALKFKADKNNNNYGGTAFDNFQLYEAPFDVGVESILSPSTACDLSINQPISVRIHNYGIRPMSLGDTIVVKVNVNHSMVPDSHTDTLILAAALNAGAYMDHTFTKTFNMNVSGDYTLTAYTDIETDKVFYSSPANDTATTIVTVQKPYVELGNDIWTLMPDTVVLDATSSDPVTYSWYKAPDKVTVIATTSTYNVTDPNGGKYYVKLENTIPCEAWDSITVNRLIRDVGIPAFDSPVSSCELSDKTPWRAYIKNFGTDTLSVGDTIQLHYIFQTNPQVDTLWAMDTTLFPNDSLIFTFADSLNLVSIDDYTLTAWASISLDEDATNNTLNSTINVWGYPTFSFATDTVHHTGISYTVDAGSVWSAYYWHNDGSTNQTFNQTVTGWATVTVYDAHSCPATDSLYVDLTFADVSVDTVIVPQTTCEITNQIYPRIIIRNAGTTTISTGTDIKLKYWLNGTPTDSATLTLDAPWYPNETKDIIFAKDIDISAINTYNFTFVAKCTVDDKPGNDTLDHIVHIYGYPTLELGDSVFTRNSSYMLDAGAGRDSYLWSTSETTQQVTVNTTNWYKVTVTENGMCASSDSVYVTFLKHDYALSEIVNPVTSCSSTLLQNVVVKYLNVSNDTLKAGEQVIFGYQIDTLYFAQEPHTLTADLYPGQFIQFTFNDAIDLSNPDTLGITAYGIYPDDINASNDTLITEFIIKDSPVVNLGPDRTSHTGSITLDGGDGTGYTYLWNDNSTNRYLIAENTDTYWVTTTAPNGCQDQDTVNLIILKPDYRISAILTPNDACQLSSSETIQVEIENLGTDTLQVGQSIFVTYGVNGQLQQTQTVTMTSKFTPGSKLVHSFTKTFDFSTPNAYLINAYTTYADDINPSNNASSKTVTVWGLPTIELGPDTAICQGNTLILDAGAGHSSYLWSTEATTQTIVINTSGEYWVEVADSHVCLNRDTINVLVNNLPTVTHAPLDSVCLDEPAFTLTGGNPAGGEYSGAGTNVTTFNASLAGSGTHTLTYTYTDINGCSNSTTVDITVHPLPVVNLGENRSTTVPLTLDAGSGFASYLWQDNSTAQTYVVNETGLYSVTVTDNNGCQAYDEVYITYLETLDVIVSELLSPTDKCYDSQSESVTVTLLNRGTKTFTSGENIEISYAIGTSNPVKEQYTFTSSFAQNDTVHFTFSNPIALSTGSFNFTCFTTLAGDNGDSTHFTVNVWELPNLEFGSDTIRHSLPYELTSGISGVTYLWSTGATSPTITISNGAWGKYWLTVTDTHGCVSSDTVVIWWPVSAGIIAETPFKISIYPNPAKDEIYVEIEGDKVSDYSIAIISPAGFTVLETKVEQTNRFTQKFEVNKLQAGMYFVRISDSLGNASILKVIIGS